MKVIMLNKYNAKIIEGPEPEISLPEHVKVKINYAAIGGNDMLIYRGKADPYYGNNVGMESSGTIVEMGKNVPDLKVGDHVAFELLQPCYHCEMCKKGKYSFCQNMHNTNLQMREYVVCDYRQLVVFPKTVPLREICMIEPAALCLYSLERIRELTGKKVLILGAGAFGLITLKLLLHYPIECVVIADPHENKRRLAKQIGADDVIDTSVLDYIPKALSITDFRGFDVVLETSGDRLSAYNTINLVARGGTVLFNALYGTDYKLPINLFNCYWKNLTILFAYPPDSSYYAKVKALIPKLKLSDIITGIFPLSEAEDAFECKNMGGHVKVMICFSEEKRKREDEEY